MELGENVQTGQTPGTDGNIRDFPWISIEIFSGKSLCFGAKRFPGQKNCFYNEFSVVILHSNFLKINSYLSNQAYK